VRTRLGHALFLVSFLFVATPRQAGAQQPVSQTFEYSPYEKETIERALEELKLELDPSPEGKTIERIDIVRLDVLEDRDPVPEEVIGIKTRKLLNSLHYTSRDFVIRREVLLHEGEPYQKVIADETARNLRSRRPLQLSIVLVVPVKGSTPDKVGLLVITKDIWSLRLSFELSVTPGGLENFILVPQETNLLGLHHTVQTRFVYQPESYTLGVGYAVPRIGKSWINASAAANIYINRRRGEPEGSAVSASVGQGLYSTRTEWGWGASAGYSVAVARLYSNAQLATFGYRTPASSLPTPAEKDAIGMTAPVFIPIEYRTSSVTASASVTRSFGWALKNNFALSMNVSRVAIRGIDLDGRDPAAVEAFRARYLPIGEDRVYPALTWATFRNDFLRTLDINTLALQEDYRLGHNVSASVYPISKALGSTRDVLGVSGTAGYALPMGDGLVGASVSTFAENDTNQKTITDASVGASFGAVTPRIGVGRIVMNTSFLNRYRNYLNARTVTGGDDRLRGYPTNFFVGKDTIFYNIEFRSTSVEILKCQLGGVAFFDAGDAAQGFDMLRAKQSVGVGVRALFPQVNRLVFRADLAFPLQRGPFPEAVSQKPVDPVGFFFTFDQAFSP
jgi:hypothetical protein